MTLCRLKNDLDNNQENYKIKCKTFHQIKKRENFNCWLHILVMNHWVVYHNVSFMSEQNGRKLAICTCNMCILFIYFHLYNLQGKARNSDKVPENNSGTQTETPTKLYLVIFAQAPEEGLAYILLAPPQQLEAHPCTQRLPSFATFAIREKCNPSSKHNFM